MSVQTVPYSQSTANTLPPGWRRVSTPDGKTYYQNDVTKQTQWSPPAAVAPTVIVYQPTPNPPQSNAIYVTSTIPPSNANVIPTLSQPNTNVISTESAPSRTNTHVTQPDDNAVPVTAASKVTAEHEEEKKRKWWHKDHLMLLCGFAYGCYNYITDIEVAISYLNIASVCPQFNCPVVAPGNGGEAACFLLIVFATVGFIFNLIKSRVEARALYNLYKDPTTKTEEDEASLRKNRRALYLGWIPVILENLLSLTIIYMMFLELFQYIISREGLYIRSMLLSVGSVYFTLAKSTLRPRRKLSKSEAHKKDNKYCKAIWCHCCWCTCSGLYAAIFAILIISDLYAEPINTIDIEDPQDPTGNPEQTGQCWFYDPPSDYDVRVFGGDIIESPALIYKNCSGTNYTYGMECQKDEDRDVVLLHCQLNWNFTAGNVSDCHHVDDMCTFDLSPGICENYTINCDNFDFFDGKPVMWACFDYCRV
eukprot:574795_1